MRLSADTLQLGRTTIRGAALALLSSDGRVEASLGDGQVRRVVEDERSALLRISCGSLGYGGRGRIH